MMTNPCTKALTAVHWSVNISTTLHVIIKKICVKRDGVEGDDKRRRCRFYVVLRKPFRMG